MRWGTATAGLRNCKSDVGRWTLDGTTKTVRCEGPGGGGTAGTATAELRVGRNYKGSEGGGGERRNRNLLFTKTCRLIFY